MFNQPHRRYNPLKQEWVLVSPHRTQRPWQGQQESPSINTLPVHDPKCYLCPGNVRANGEVNPNYSDTFVFNNDYSALLPQSQSPAFDNSNDLFQTEPASGECRVICFSKQHNLTLAEMTTEDIKKVVELWIAQTKELGQRYRWVQIFENKGAVMGCSNPHPHGQIWASEFLPNEASTEEASQRKYYQKHQQALLLNYAQKEMLSQERIVAENADWLVVVPYWAIWPFETLLLPKFSVSRMTELDDKSQRSLADILKVLLGKYDRLFNTSFPYSMGWHGAPIQEGDFKHWQLHAHFYPPLLRSATVKKFMVGYEMLAEAQRDLTAEQAAERLRSL